MSAQESAAAESGDINDGHQAAGASTTDGPVAIAAAMSFSVAEADVSAVVTGTISAANGTVSVVTAANQDDLASADGSATSDGSSASARRSPSAAAT